MYDKCYFCLDQLPKLKKRIHSKLFRKFWRNRGTKEPAYITVYHLVLIRIGSGHFPIWAVDAKNITGQNHLYPFTVM